MPIDFDNLDEFRIILKELEAKKGLTTNKLVALWNDHRVGKEKILPAVSANTLRKFRAGDAITKTDLLAEFWDFLEKHKIYGYAFKSSQQTIVLPPPEEAFASALTRFFSESGEPKTKAIIYFVPQGLYVVQACSCRLLKGQ